ncbi:Pre-mRNA cleavage complex 2 protein Pcf11 [Gracilariopsis chorda]|uniref:Pre-mRNA cleavage complex 2 protein Pcf11 n=1 Tax=Gracilariopsis chorda TaxID=448386 RepID=A0A2V3J430_9FLOR|nr:Pre-mRNA cleavage complex 2 protein Pcf11 [Gracilariopsis chorda]|eukprot:PXF49145.1 Pre-mRNA cleavage complex 2 protein Pcf11 [Gracilariopsis chorda]
MFHQSNYVSNAPPHAPSAPPPSIRPPLDLSSIPPTFQEAALEYDAFLNELTWNSKQVINQLTTIAADNLSAADAISSVIEQRIFNAAPTIKLPFLYLMDSIVKNVGRRYLSRFAENLFHTFTDAYAVAPPTVRMSLRRMLSTWPDIYGFELVNAMTTRANQIDATPYGQMHPHAPPPSAMHHPPHQPPPYFAQPPRVPIPPAPHARVQAAPQPAIPVLHSQPIHPAPIPVSQVPPVPARALPLRSSLRSAPARPAVLPPPPVEFVQLERMMTQVIRNASMGALPSNHQLFTLNSMITSQLQSTPPIVQRNALLRYQRQLRDISSAPRHRNTPTPTTPSTSAPSSVPPPSQVPRATVSNVLNNLLRAMPPGLLHTVQSVAQSSRPMPTASVADPPSPAVLTRHPAAPRLPNSAAPSFPAAPTSPVLLFANLKNMSHHAGVRSLYTDLPYLSKSDGMRFATKEALREHLDWLFRQNRRKRGTREQVVVGGQSRGWFDTLDVFLGTVDPNAKPTNPSVNKKNVEDDNDDRTVSVVEAKSDNDICAACHEAFETFWDDDKHAWMLRDCTRTDDDELYHVKCMQYAVLNADESDDIPQQQEDDGIKPDIENTSPASTNIITNSQGFSSTNVKTDPMPKPNSAAAEAVPSTNGIKTELAKLRVEETGARGSTANFASQVESSNKGSTESHASYQTGMLKKEHELAKQGGEFVDPTANNGEGMSLASVSATDKKDMKGHLTDGHPTTEDTKQEPLELKGNRNTQVTSTPPSGQKRKRMDNEAEWPSGQNVMETTVIGSAELKGVEIPERPSKRQKESVSKGNS